MTVLARLTQRALTPSQIFGAALDDVYRGETAAGINVTAEKAMQAASGKCIRLLADDIAQLPVDFYRKVGDESLPITPPEWYTYPTTRRWDTWPDHITEVVVSLLADGNSFVQGMPNTVSPEYLYVLDPDTTTISERAGRVVITNGSAEYGDGDVAHIKWVRLPGKLRALNPVEAAKESTGLELAAREWAASFFANGATLSGVIKVPAGVPMNEAATNSLRDAFASKHVGRRKSHAFGILTGGADFKELTINPQQAELGALWQHVLEEAAALYHIPPHMLASQVSGGQAYASVEQKSIDYVVHAIVPIVRRLEAAYSRFLPGDDTFVKFNVNALLRGDFKSQAEGFAVYLDKKVIRREEVRAKLDLPRDPDALGYLETPNNNAPQEPPA